jgi:predicted nucleic acid-binding protein
MFSVHSIGVILYRRGMIGAYADILKATSIGDEVSVVGLGISELARVQAACSELRLDFDDAYQYVVADVHQFKLVSLDADFDHTPNGRLMPVQAVERFSRFSDS